VEDQEVDLEDKNVKWDELDPAVPDPRPFDAYKALTPSQRALIHQLVTELRGSW
jgi:hypothetical protein